MVSDVSGICKIFVVSQASKMLPEYLQKHLLDPYGRTLGLDRALTSCGAVDASAS